MATWTALIGQRRRQWFAVDQFGQGIGRVVNATVEIAGAEFRRDVFADDACAGDIRNRALKAAADFDAHAMVVLGDNQDHAVVGALAPELPCVADADAVLRDILRLGGRHDQHAYLRTLALFERAQVGFERLLLLRIERAGNIGDMRAQRRDRLLSIVRKGNHRQKNNNAKDGRLKQPS